MYDHCRPEVFFNQIRIYLNGFDKEHFPDGLKIENFDQQKIIYYRGGSAAQSTLIQILDVLLHENEIGCDFSKKFLEEMLDYMPLKHKNYLLHLKKNKEKYNLHQYIYASKDNRLIEMYNANLHQLKIFRACHFKLVKDYVFKFIGRNVHGTGGTNARNFLSDIIVSTGKSVIKVSQNNMFENFYMLLAYALIIFLSYMLAQ